MLNVQHSAEIRRRTVINHDKHCMRFCFLQRYCWVFRFPGMLHCLDRSVVLDLSKENGYFIVKVRQASVTACPTNRSSHHREPDLPKHRAYKIWELIWEAYKFERKFKNHRLINLTAHWTQLRRQEKCITMTRLLIGWYSLKEKCLRYEQFFITLKNAHSLHIEIDNWMQL